MSFFSFQDIIACTTGIMVLITLMLALELITRSPNPPAPLLSIPELAGNVKEANQHLAEMRKAIKKRQETLTQVAGREMITKSQVDALDEKVDALRKNKSVATDKLRRLKISLGNLERERDQEKQKTREQTEALEKLQEELDEQKSSPPLTTLEGTNEKTPLLVECAVKEIGVGQKIGKLSGSGKVKEVERFKGDDFLEDFFKWASGRQTDNEYFVLLIRPEAVGHWLPIANKLKSLDFDLGWDVWPENKALFAKP